MSGGADGQVSTAGSPGGLPADPDRDADERDPAVQRNVHPEGLRRQNLRQHLRRRGQPTEELG